MSDRAMDAIHDLRRCAWKGGRNGLPAAITLLRDPNLFQAAAYALDELADAYDQWADDHSAENRDELEAAISTFDDACEPLFGITEWQIASER